MLWVRISIRARCTPLCDKVCQWLATGRWLSPDPPVSSTNKTDPHDITEILLKVALSTIKPTKYILLYNFRRENSTLLEPQDVDKISSSESILTESCRSAPCDLRENSVTDINIPRRTLFRRSSTGSNEELELPV
jgi:hypothetical protein